MKKLAMTICGAAFMSVSVLAQEYDSMNNSNGSTGINDVPAQYPIKQPTDSQSIYSTPQTDQQQQQLSPIIQQQFQRQPQIQSQPRLQSQPGIRFQPLQTNPQIPSQSQPLDLNSPTPQNQFERPIQPAEPAVPSDPASPGARP